jgi:4-hydroxybenzoate polyprenyltransferase
MWERAAKFFVSTSLLLSIDGILIFLFGSYLYQTQINIPLAIAAFLVVFSVYNLNKATDKVEDKINQRETATKSKSLYIALSIVTMLVSLTIGALNDAFAFLILATPIIIGIFYSIKISPKIPRLKEITGAKSVLVAFSWSLNGALLPLYAQPIDFEKLALVFTYIFAQVMINTILFDSLDTKGDLVSGIKTIPTALGPKRTKKLLLFANSTLVAWLGFCYFENLFLKFIPALLVGVIYGYIIVLKFLNKDARKVSTEMIIDGEWLLIVPIMRLIH